MSTAPDLSVLEGRLSYAQSWEDPAVLSAALRVGPEDDVLSIAASGDNSFALAIDGARSVTCVDLSAPQLHLCRLKLAAARALPVEGMRSMLGLDPPGRRVWFYHQVRGALEPAARAWWDGQEERVRTGVLGSGRYERYLDLFRRRMLPLVHRRRTVQALLAQSDPASQHEFYARRWDTLPWRSMVRVFFSRPVMARTGRSQAHFRYVQGPVAEVFLNRARHVMTDLPIATNPFLQWILGGGYPDLDAAHPYLSRDGHAVLAARADRLRFVQANLESYLRGCEPGSFSAFNYSNLFEYLDEGAHQRILELTLRAARPGARIAYWNLLVPRSRPAALADRLERREQKATALLREDRAFVYGGFNLEIVRE